MRFPSWSSAWLAYRDDLCYGAGNYLHEPQSIFYSMTTRLREAALVPEAPGPAGTRPQWLDADTGGRQYAEAALAGEKRVLELIAGGKGLPAILEELCRAVEDVCRDSLCSIGLLDSKGERLVIAAAPSFPKSYLELFKGHAIAGCWGPCAAAAYQNEQVIASDIQADPRWTRCREIMSSHGIRACWSTPIRSSEGKVLGTLAILSRRPCTPGPRHQDVIRQFTHLAMIAIERIGSEESLRRSEAYLAEAQKLSQTGSFGWNVSTGELFWSDETFHILGYDRGLKPTLELVLGRVHPEDVGFMQRMISIASNEGTNLDFEHRVVMPNGAIKHLHVIARAVKNRAGETEFIGAVMDVTQRKRTEAALRRSESRFQGILEIADDAILSVDAEQRIVLFNQGAEKVFGYEASEMIGQPLEFLIPERFAQAHRTHLKKFAEAPEISRTMAERREVYGRRKDGREFPAEASISKLVLGDEVLYTVILRDITERKQAAEALRASAQVARGQVEALGRTLDALAKESVPDRLVEHVLRTITGQLQAHSSSVWVRDESTGLVRFEFAFEEGRLLTGTDAALAKISPSLSIDEVIPWPEVFRTKRPAVLEDIRQGPDFPWREHVLALGVVTILVAPMLIAGDVIGVVGIRFTRKRSFGAEEIELAQALAHQAMLACQIGRLSRQSRQAAIVAERNRLAREIHDTLAQGFTGVIVQLEAVEEAMSKGLKDEVAGCLARAGALARESLREARRSVRALRPQSLEDNDLCEALQHLIHKMTAGSALHAKFDVWGRPPELPQEWEDNLLRIGQEVLTNALRHAQARQFKARLTFEEAGIRLMFSDNGVGFNPAARHEGFGLKGIRERVAAMGGRLELESASGHGTTVSIDLPLPNLHDGIYDW